MLGGVFVASMWAELKRRNVVKVAVAYAVVGWLLVQVAATVLPIFEAPIWILQVFTFFVILGFPLALILSWAYELTPEGVKRSHEVSAAESTTHITGRKIDFAIITVLVLALGFVVFNYVLEEPPITDTATEDRRSIAALPFSNESAAGEDAEFLANGIHDELLTLLAQISSLKVISRTSVIGYRVAPKNIREIGRELGVETVLEGRVQRAGDTLRINVQLIDAETDEHLWAMSYDREFSAENVFAIQSEMATAIANALHVTLLPEEVVRLNEVPTRNQQALIHYLRGTEYARSDDEERDLPLAVTEFILATDLDPEYALAWAKLSSIHYQMHTLGLDPSEARLVMAQEALERAQDLAPDLPEVRMALAGSFRDRGDRERAVVELEAASRSMPGNAVLHMQRAFFYRRMGRWNESIEAFQRWQEYDPLNREVRNDLARTYYLRREYERAEEMLDLALQLAPDDEQAYADKALLPLWRDGNATLTAATAADESAPLGDVRARMGWIAALYDEDYALALEYVESMAADYVYRGDRRYIPRASYLGVTYQLWGQAERAQQHFQEAFEHLEEMRLENPADARLYVTLGEALVGLNEREEAIDHARHAIELLPRSDDTIAGPRIQIDAIVRVFASAGAVEDATRELDDYLSNEGEWSIEGLLPDPRFNGIREDPRFVALVERHSAD